MLTARSFLVRGLLAGLLAGLAAFVVASLVGEPSVGTAIALESAGGAAHEAESTLVPRSLQSTAGLLTGTLVAGATLGGLVGVLSALALGRFGRVGPRATTLAVAAAGFVTLYVVPTWAYPPNPPAVGEADTIGMRTALFFTLVAVSLLAAVVAVLTGRRLGRTWGGWYGTLAGVAAYLVLAVVAVAVLPSYDEVPAGFPAALLFEFRRASFLTQLSLWAVLGVVLAELVHRLSVRAVAVPAPVVDPTGVA